jgi:hypothetical protein
MAGFPVRWTIAKAFGLDAATRLPLCLQTCWDFAIAPSTRGLTVDAAARGEYHLLQAVRRAWRCRTSDAGDGQSRISRDIQP